MFAQSKTLASELAAIKQKLIGYECKLKKANVDFILKTLDGDQAKWKAIQLECDTLLEKAKSLGGELKEIVVGDQLIQFRPSNNHIEKLFGSLDTGSIDSTIIGNFKMENNLLELCKLKGRQFKLLYRATRDGFAASSFHAKCDQQPKTLTVIKTSNGCIFGGYTSVAWDSTSRHKADPNAFIFSLVNAKKQPQYMPIKTTMSVKAVYCFSSHGPVFGSFDICICNSKLGYSELGKIFDFKLFPSETADSQSFLAGSREFQVAEIETFYLI